MLTPPMLGFKGLADKDKDNLLQAPRHEKEKTGGKTNKQKHWEVFTHKKTKTPTRFMLSLLLPADNGGLQIFEGKLCPTSKCVLRQTISCERRPRTFSDMQGFKKSARTSFLEVVMECSPSNFGNKPGKRSHEIQEQRKMEKEESRAAAGLRARGATGPQGEMFPEDKTGHIPRVCERTFAQPRQFGVGVGVGSDKYINHKADAKTASGEKKMS